MARIELPSRARIKDDDRFDCVRVAAYAHELTDVPHLLAHLCGTVKGPKREGWGLTPKPYRDRLYCVILTEYYGHSAQRSVPHYEAARTKGHISSAHSSDEVQSYYGDEFITGQLHELIRVSGRALMPYETHAMLNRAEFVTEEKPGYRGPYTRTRSGVGLRPAAHLLGGAFTRGVFAAAVDACADKNKYRLGREGGLTEGLLRRARANGFEFRDAEVWTDKAYRGASSRLAIESVGAKCKIIGEGDTKSGLPYCTLVPCGCRECYQGDWVETISSMIKQATGEKVFCSNKVSLENEVLARVVAHNMRAVQQMMVGADIPVDFEANADAERLPPPSQAG